MMRPSVQGVDHPVCCVLDAVVTYARDSSCCLLSSRGGGRHTGTRLTGGCTNDSLSSSDYPQFGEKTALSSSSADGAGAG